MTAYLDDVADEMFVRNPEDWRHAAACRDEDPELFFPVGISPAAQQQTARAKAVCHGCPVMYDCRAWAFAVGEYQGVWGGLDEEERRQIHRRTAPPPKPGRNRHPRQVARYPKRHEDL